MVLRDRARVLLANGGADWANPVGVVRAFNVAAGPCWTPGERLPSEVAQIGGVSGRCQYVNLRQRRLTPSAKL